MRRTVFYLLALSSLLGGQLVPRQFALSKALVDSNASYYGDSTSYSGLAGNSIIDIYATGDSLLFFGSNRGLTLTGDRGRTFRSYVAEEVNLPRGGISALAVDDSVIVVAGIMDSLVAGEYNAMGTGIAYSLDSGDTWTYLPQPREDPADTSTFMVATLGDSIVRRLRITTAISNTTYDLAYARGVIWAASWAGGLRKYDLDSLKWSVVFLPQDGDTTLSCSDIPAGYELNPLDPKDGGNHNHKGFSVIAYDSLVWVGTVAGINKGIIDDAGCIAWTHYTSRWNQLSANWVVGLHHQVTASVERIWAAAWRAESAGEERGVSYTEDGGRTWNTTLLGEKANNITSFGDDIYVSTENGLFKSEDGSNWAPFLGAVDSITGEQIWADEVYGCLIDSRDSTLWIGTPDGLAHTGNQGIKWRVERSFVSTGTTGEARFYAYPNPFYRSFHNVLRGTGHVRFQYHITASETGRTAVVDIYDFAMNPVKSLIPRQHGSAGDFSQVWDGRNEAGFEVANGVYYCRLALGSSDYWTKVIVIK